MSSQSSSTSKSTVILLNRRVSSSSSSSSIKRNASSMVDRRNATREQRSIKRALRSAERAGDNASVAINSLTQVPTILLSRSVDEPLQDAFWDALVCAEDASTPPRGVVVRDGVASRIDTVPTPFTHPPALRSVVSSAPVVAVRAAPVTLSSFLVQTPTATATTVVDPNASPSFQKPTSLYGMEVWPPFFRRRTFVYHMPSADRRLDGKCVIYYQVRAPRIDCNLAFCLARHTARALELPLIVLSYESDLLSGVHFEHQCAMYGIALLRMTMGTLNDVIVAMNARMCFIDEPGNFITRSTVRSYAKSLAGCARSCPLIAVSAATLMPSRYRERVYSHVDELRVDWQSALDEWFDNIRWIASPPRRGHGAPIELPADLAQIFAQASQVMSLSNARFFIPSLRSESEHDLMRHLSSWLQEPGTPQAMPVVLEDAIFTHRLCVFQLLDVSQVGGIAMSEQHRSVLRSVCLQFEWEALRIIDGCNASENQIAAQKQN